MTTAQIIILSILGIIALIGYFGNCLSKKESSKFLYLLLLTFATTLFALIVIIQTQALNELEEKTNVDEYLAKGYLLSENGEVLYKEIIYLNDY